MADKDEMDELKKLSPRQRLEKLKELEGKKEKELNQAKKLIEDSIKELEDEERISKITERVEMPKAQHVDIGKLFEKKEKDSRKRTGEPEENLEDAVSAASQ